MKLLASLFLCFLCLNVSSQLLIESEYLFKQAVFNDLPILDKDGRKVMSLKLYNTLYKTDYFNIHRNRKEQFFDLISNSISFYTSERYGVLKLRNFVKSGFTEIYFSIFNDETGVFIEDKSLFLFNSKLLYELDTIQITPNKKDITEILNGMWSIQSIESRGKKMELDSCLRIYRLNFLDNKKFSQGYYGKIKCALLDLKNSNFKHRLSFGDGFWKVMGDQLVFVDPSFQNLKTWEFEIKNDILKLIFGRNNDYIVTLKKQSSK